MAMSYAQLLHCIPEGLRRLYRQYENVSKKLINTKWSIEFNSICLKENLQPNYSRIKHHDPAKRRTLASSKYEKNLVEQENKDKMRTMKSLQTTQDKLLEEIELYECDVESKEQVFSELCDILRNSENVTKTRTVKKLNNLYFDSNNVASVKSICFKKDTDSFINLSTYELSKEEREFLNLGLNCHIQPKYNRVNKQVNIEILYQNLLDLKSKKQIDIKPELADRLRSEGTKHRNPIHNSILSNSLKAAAKTLRNNNDIVIRRADKSAIYVIMNRSEYISKVNDILKDTSKFKQISKNPIDQLKQDVNQLIETQNAVIDDIKLPKIIGDFQPGYIFGNVKIHKEGNPLRPIISQIPTPTYNLAKTLNKIISPFIPNQFTVKSSNDFLDLLKSSNCSGIIGSLDVESLFTNVPIDKTIEIILKHVYNHPTIDPPKITPKILQKLLELCTKEAPFRCPEGKLYKQIGGVAMGSPLGPTFANFYMGELESNVLENHCQKPLIYVRYVDDIFVLVKNEEELIHLKQIFQEQSVLNFTYEIGVEGKLPFLDITVNNNGSKFETSVYHKPTDQGKCLNYDSECPEKYKISVITNYINRAYRISDSWHNFHQEISHVRQILVNNNYPNALFDSQLKKFLDKKQSIKEPIESKHLIPIYYESQMHNNYQIEERAIKDIVYNNTKCHDKNSKINLIFYYKNLKTANLVMKNNMSPVTTKLQQSDVVYKFSCPLPHSQAVEYVGLCQTTLSRRLTMHGQDGGILKHFETNHNTKPTREQLTENTVIIDKASDRYRLAIKEALHIIHIKPLINTQYDNFSNILKLYNHRPNTQKTKTVTNPTKLGPNLQTISSPPNNTKHGPIVQTTPLSPTQDPPNTQQLTLSLDDNSSTNEIGIPDMDIVLQKFGIDSSKFRNVSLKKYEKEMFLTKNSIDDDESHTISQRIGSMTRKARYSKRKRKSLDTHQLNNVTNSNDIFLSLL